MVHYMTDNIVMMRLGSYSFSLERAAYQTLERKSNYRWQSLDRVGAKPMAQFIGSGSDIINLAGVIFPYFKGGLGQINAMRNEASRGKPLLLISQFGDNLGKFCILEITENHTKLNQYGIAQKIDFSMRLMEYGDDDLEILL